MKTVDRLMTQALDEHIFPGAVLLVSENGGIRYARAFGRANIFKDRPVKMETLFDLASLTKPLATSLAIMRLVQTGRIRLEQTIGSILAPLDTPEKAPVRVEHLLSHTSGFPAYRPYFQKLARLPQGQRSAALKTMLAAEPLHSAPGEAVCYSDLGFMVLAWIVEAASNLRLDEFVTQSIYRPLGLDRLFYVNLDRPRPQGEYAATEVCPWRKTLMEGAVHDENTYIVGGVGGQAGLFGDAPAIHTLLKHLIDAYRGGDTDFSSDLVRRFFTRFRGKPVALGFDVPAATGSSAGTYFSKNSIGHLGFTGTSFWVDLDHRIITILLTNRVHPSRDNDKLKGFRSRLHDTVRQAL